MRINEIVNGENFKTLADVIIDVDTIHMPRGYSPGQVVFCKTDFIDLFFHEVHEFSGPLKLITHLSDYSVTKEIFENRPLCVDKWFAQNADYQHKYLIPVPIGLENHKGPSKGTCIDEEFINNDLEGVREIGDKLRQGLIYANFSNTHPDRAWKRDILFRNEMVVFADSRPYADYFRDLCASKYVASPRGNGIDCHRHWEALLAGAIPLVDPHFMFDFWSLPVIQIQDWNNIELYEPKGSLEVLEMKYWVDKIKK